MLDARPPEHAHASVSTAPALEIRGGPSPPYVTERPLEAISGSPAPLTCDLRTRNLDHQVEFDGGIKRQLGHTDGGADVAAGVAEDLD